jgi:C1A family cysteine protease
MPDQNKISDLSRIVVGVSIAVLAALFIWVCSTTRSSETRITVLESQFTQIVKDTDAIKSAQQRQTALAQETALAVQELKTMLKRQYGQ